MEIFKAQLSISFSSFCSSSYCCGLSLQQRLWEEEQFICVATKQQSKRIKICATYFKNSCGTTTTTITTRVAIRDCSLSCATCHALSSCTCWAKNKYNNKGNITQEVEAWGNCYKTENGKLKRQVRGDFRCGRRRRSLSRRRRMSHSRVCHNGKWYVLLYNSNENKLTVTCYTPTVTHIHAMIMCTHG